MKFIIYGVGAIGGTLAARLAEAGHEVAGIARGKQLEALRKDGLLLRTPQGEVRARFDVADSPSGLEIGPDDVIILAVKGQDTASALTELIAAGVTTQPIVCAQNGVDNERAAARLFPNVYAMTVILAATFVRPGEVAAFGTPRSGVLDIGRFPHGIDATVEALVAAFNGAKCFAFAHEHPMRKKYGKLIGNLGNVLDAAAGEGGQQVAVLDDARAEARAALAAASIEVEDLESPAAAARTGLVSLGEVEGAERVGSSSSQSLVRGTGTIETDYLNGEIVLLGRLHGVPTPVNAAFQALGRHLIEQRLKPGDMSRDDVVAFVRARG